MESPSKSVLGGGLITAFVLGGLVSAAVLVDPGAPPARAAAGLTPFDSCAELQSWYVDHTIDQVGPYGWGGRRLDHHAWLRPGGGRVSSRTRAVLE